MAATAGGSFKNPPKFRDGELYDSWKNEIAIWQLMTDFEKKKQALAITLTLEGQAKAKALELDVTTLNAEDGVATLLSALDELYLKDTVDIAYSAYTEFDKYSRPANTHINDYIIEFERLHNRCKKHEMGLPDAVLSFKLLDNANLTHEERKLALTAASDLKFISMKSGLKRIFGSGEKKVNQEFHGIQIKQESAFLAYGQNKNQRFMKLQKPSQNFPRGTNPLDRQGRRTRCSICGSVFHWFKDCEHKNDNKVKVTEHTEEECNLTLFTKEVQSHNLILLTEALGTAVVDTGCSRTVCGKKWLEDYMDSLENSEKPKVIESTCNRTYRFGDGAKVFAMKNVSIPANIAGKHCSISTDVVDIDLPLLLSKQSLKKADAILDLSKDEATLFGQKVTLQQTSSGHYCVDLKGQRNINEKLSNHQILIVKEIKTEKEREKDMLKLHRQFGHAASDRLKKLLINAGCGDDDLLKAIEKVVKECDVCQRYRRTPRRPIVSLPMASDWNETVSVDLHQLEPSLWFFHIIDMFTRYSAGAVVRTKTGTEIIEKFIKHWISVFGPPKKLFSDNGGEFQNGEMLQMGEMFGIEILSTAAYSPWSNGICERHNLTLSEIVEKVKADRNCSWDIALCWALMAKNSLCNVYGYSPHQLVFGKNPNLSSVISDKLPALEGKCKSQLVAEHMSSMFAARKAYTEAECSERIRRALRKQTRTYMDEVYYNGDKVYYKRPSQNEWKGPGKVIGQDGVVVFVRHGSQLIRVHVCRLKKVVEKETERNEVNIEGSINEQQNKSLDLQTVEAKNFDDEDDDTPQSNSTTGSSVNSSEQMEHELNNNSEVKKSKHTEDQAIDNNEIPNSDNDQVCDYEQEQETSFWKKEVLKLKKGQQIRYKLRNNEESYEATVLGRAGKSTGKNKSWYNVRNVDENGDIKTMSINVEELENVEVLESLPSQISENQEEDIFVVEQNIHEHAKTAEFKSWIDHRVFTRVKDEGQKAISTRWICTVKEKDGELVPKARLVARGFEEMDDTVEKDSPTCSNEALKVVLTIMGQKQWIPKSMDIKTAFLQGDRLERDVFLKPPREAKEKGYLWHLEKCVYGLGDASLYWYKKVKTSLLKLGARISKSDPAVFYWLDNAGELIGMLACHVDDFLWGGTKWFEMNIVYKIRKEFIVGREEESSFKYVGINIQYKNGEILYDQNFYAENLELIELSKARVIEKDCDISEEERTLMRAKIGQLLWLGRQSRPDIVFDTCLLAARIKDAKVRDLQEVNKLLKRAKSEKLTLHFSKLDKPFMLVYSDSSLGNLRDGGTQGGHFICMTDDKGFISPLCWSSKKIRRVVRSTLAGETLAMADALDAALFLCSLYTELMFGISSPESLKMDCFTDCKSLWEAVKSNKAVTEKRLRIDIGGIKESIEKGQVREFKWIDSKKQLADCLTKKGASSMQLLRVLEKGRFE